MPRKRIWINYDLGIKGDYEGMYQFLDSHDAQECGDGAASFMFEFSQDLIEEFTKSLKDSISFEKRERVYLISPKNDGTYSGRFIVGKRKPPVWAGYAASESTEEDVGG